MDQEQTTIIKKAVLMFERYSFQQVCEYLKNLRLTDVDSYWFLLDAFQNDLFFSALAGHKIALAKIILSSAGVQAMDSDRSRVVWLLARHKDANFKAVSQAFKAEFGPDFQLVEKYLVSKTWHSWKELAVKAAQIRIGFKNYDFICVRPAVLKMVSFYKSFQQNDVKILDQIIKLGAEILPKTTNNPLLSPTTTEMQPVNDKIAQFYKLTNRLPLDIENIKTKVSYNEINDFIFSAKTSAELRRSMIVNKLEPNDYDWIEGTLYGIYGTFFSDSYMGDELARHRVQLKAAGVK